MRGSRGRDYGGNTPPLPPPPPENHKVSIEISVDPHFPWKKVGNPPPPPPPGKCWTPAGTSVRPGTFKNYSFLLKKLSITENKLRTNVK